MAYLWMLLGCFAFAWMGQFAGMLRLRDCDWSLVALARGSLAFLFALLLAWCSGAPLTFLRPRALWMRSIAGSVSLLCTFYAYNKLRPAEVLTLTNTFPMWVAVLSWPILRQRPSLSVWVAAACGVAGVFLMQADKVEFLPGTQLAVGLALGAAFTSSIAMLGLNRLKGLHPWAIVAHFSGVATAFVLGAWLVQGGPSLAPLQSWDTAALLLGVGATATAGQLCLTLAFTAGIPARVSVIGLSQIPMAMLLELLFGAPAFGFNALMGTILVIVPTAWVMAGPRPEPAEAIET